VGFNDCHFKIGDFVEVGWRWGDSRRGFVIKKATEHGDSVYLIDNWAYWTHGFQLRLITPLDQLAELAE
jgi:hypothetical protein